MFNIVLIFYTVRAVERICRKFKGVRFKVDRKYKAAMSYV